jgi:dethiobiotin synthetase
MTKKTINEKHKGIFVTGTDTEIGKTYVTALLIEALIQSGMRVAGMKPIASGFENINGDWLNEDIESIKRVSNVDVSDELINRYGFKPAIAPHIACAQEGQSIDLELIHQDFMACSALSDIVCVEGAGGWRVPLSSNEFGQNLSMADLAACLDLPVVLVVGMKLGCINHALLTAQAVQADGLTLAGWVANCVELDMPEQAANIQALKSLMPAPHIATVPFKGDLHDSLLCSQLSEWIEKLAI